MATSVELEPADIIAMVAELAAVDPASISGPIWRQSVKQARIAAAHLLRTRCGLSRAETARHLGRSDQAISDFTTQAKHSIASAGCVYDLIAARTRCSAVPRVSTRPRETITTRGRTVHAFLIFAAGGARDHLHPH